MCTLEEEERLTIVEVSGRTRAAFDVERVTKRFYDQFQKEHEAFLKFIKGIEAVADREWYASVMLNRLMFVYFIQRKGFLDGDPHYLRNRLTRCQAERGKDTFYSFYRYFLIRLFHEGFGSKTRTTELEQLLGRIPYLNGGLFDVHELEKPERYGKNIQIPDETFERIFGYFDQWDWVLDPHRTVRKPGDKEEINPDVLGYIFEKYINQKQMGAYYTIEDITGYISQNTVIPFLFDAARTKCKVAFENPKGPTLWDVLKDMPDRYIYEAVKKGIELPLPAEIAAGREDVSKRKGWNKPAPSEYGLPTETWREVAARRQRYEVSTKKLLAGEVRDINDLITLNLDIRQFAQDIIENCEGPELLRAFWHAIENVTILDPTCGSGAFLFAALNILEPLYEACLERMEAFLEDAAAKLEKGKLKRTPHGYPQLPHGKFEDFTKLLDRVAEHPNARSFILKSIILNNLYGIDIMEEAVEICKLRLFLKLAAQVEPDLAGPNLGIEALPDIDFNIRAGNTLVGYASLNELKKSMEGDWVSLQSLETIEENAEIADRAFQKFHEMQTEQGMEAKDFSAAKFELRKRLKALEDELNRYLAQEYGVLPPSPLEGEGRGEGKRKSPAFEQWLTSHKPFHWFIEFYGIMKSGGFDVSIGNPPYFDLKQGISYTVRSYATFPTKNLYPLIIERCIPLSRNHGRLGFIVPISSISTEGYYELQKVVMQLPAHFSSYDDRPARLFDGLEHIQLTIHLIENKLTPTPEHFVSECYRWSAAERPNLFPLLEYENVESRYLPSCIPKLSNPIEHSILKKVFEDGNPLGSQLAKSGKHEVYYSRKVHNFLQALDFVPKVYDGTGKLRPPSELKPLVFYEKEEASAAFCILNSTLFRWFVNVFSDCRHVNKREVEGFRCNLQRLLEIQEVKSRDLARELSASLQINSEFRKMRFRHDHLRVQCIIPKHSKPIIDKIDRVLAKHYGFTDEELDFIINYDIKYRMGRDAEGGEE